jgi:hypothetical protein
MYEDIQLFREKSDDDMYKTVVMIATDDHTYTFKGFSNMSAFELTNWLQPYGKTKIECNSDY